MRTLLKFSVKVQLLIAFSVFAGLAALSIILPSHTFAITNNPLSTQTPQPNSGNVYQTGANLTPWLAVGTGQYNGPYTWAKVYIPDNTSADIVIDQAGCASDVGAPTVTYSVSKLNGDDSYNSSFPGKASGPSKCGTQVVFNNIGGGIVSTIPGHTRYDTYYVLAHMTSQTVGDERSFRISVNDGTGNSKVGLSAPEIGYCKITNNSCDAADPNSYAGIYARTMQTTDNRPANETNWNFGVQFAPNCNQATTPTGQKVQLYDMDPNHAGWPQPNLRALLDEDGRNDASYSWNNIVNKTAFINGNAQTDNLSFQADNTHRYRLQLQDVYWRNTIQVYLPYDEFDAQQGFICQAGTCISTGFSPSTINAGDFTNYTVTLKNTGLGSLTGLRVKATQVPGSGAAGTSGSQIVNQNGPIKGGATGQFSGSVTRNQASPVGNPYQFSFDVINPNGSVFASCPNASFKVAPAGSYFPPTGDIYSDCTFVAGHIHFANGKNGDINQGAGYGKVAKGYIIFSTNTADTRTVLDAGAGWTQGMPTYFGTSSNAVDSSGNQVYSSSSFIFGEWDPSFYNNPANTGTGVGVALVPTHSYIASLYAVDSNNEFVPVVNDLVNRVPATTIISPTGPAGSIYSEDSGKCLHITPGSCQIQINNPDPEPGQITSGHAVMEYVNSTAFGWDAPYYGVRTEVGANSGGPGVTFSSPSSGNNGPNSYLSSPAMAPGISNIDVPITIKISSSGYVSIYLDTALPGQNPTPGGPLMFCSRPLVPATRPYFRIKGGDVSTGGQFNVTAADGSSYCALDSTYNSPSYTADNTSGGVRGFGYATGEGASSDFATWSLGEINGTLGTSYGYTTGNLNPTRGNSQTGSNPPGMFGGLLDDTSLGLYGFNIKAHCLPDYFNATFTDPGWADRLGSACSSSNTASIQTPDSGSTLKQQYCYDPNAFNKAWIDVFDASGVGCDAIAQPVSCSYTQIPPGSSTTYYINGDILIWNNLVYSRNGWTPLADNVPSLTFVVRGNIFVANGVYHLDGNYIAQPDPNRDGVTDPTGRFVTCTPVNGISKINRLKLPNADMLAGNSAPSDNCQKSTLTVNGNVVAKELLLTRSSGTLIQSSSEVETFNNVPSGVLGRPEFVGNQDTLIPGSTTGSFVLPPVF